MTDMIVLYDKFFNLPIEDKEPLFSKEYTPGCMLYTGGFYYDNDSVHMWKDTLKHDCYPLEKQIPTWPDKPARYRDVVERYVVEMRKMAFKVLAFIEEGLGLNAGYSDELSQGQSMSISYYPPCPDPSLAMGIHPHHDLNLITFIQQDIYGLQIEKDGKWMGFDPLSNAFVIVIGSQFEALSNGDVQECETSCDHEFKCCSNKRWHIFLALIQILSYNLQKSWLRRALRRCSNHTHTRNSWLIPSWSAKTRLLKMEQHWICTDSK